MSKSKTLSGHDSAQLADLLECIWELQEAVTAMRNRVSPAGEHWGMLDSLRMGLECVEYDIERLLHRRVDVDPRDLPF